MASWDFAALVAAVAVCAAATALSALRPTTTDSEQHGYVPRRTSHDGYVSSVTCRKCHEPEYRSWKASFHRTMTQLVTPTTVRGNFDGAVREHDGVDYRYFRRGGGFFVEEYDRALDERTTRQVVLSTGSHHYQVYWLASDRETEPRESLLYWSIDAARWIPKQSTVLAPPEEEEERGVWNAHCIRCHSVGGAPHYKQGSYHSEVAEYGISCEACHGPAETHVSKQQNPLRRYAEALTGAPDASIVNPAKLSKTASSQVCGRCHAAYAMNLTGYARHGFAYRPGGDLEKEVTLHTFGSKGAGSKDYAAGFWSDGSPRVGGDEFNAHSLSPCYQNGELTCLSCHSMHDSKPNDQLAAEMDGNQACLQCHGGMQNKLAQHTHHSAESSGSTCYNCHMPLTTWALSTAMRSHRIDSPRASGGDQNGKPNACNLCHLDKTLAWTSDKLQAWYGQKPPELSAEHRSLAASAVWLVRGNAMQRVISAWHFSWAPARAVSTSGWQAPLLAELLADPYAQVRFIAGQSLVKLPGFVDFGYDFLAPASQLEGAKNRALTLWNAQPKRARSASERAAIVLDAAGSLDVAALARLQAARDDTLITIPE